jgi:hypothetical protein
MPQHNKLSPDMALLPYDNRVLSILEVPYAAFRVQIRALPGLAISLLASLVDLACHAGRKLDALSQNF